MAERSRLDTELLQRNRELLALSDIARALNQAHGVTEILDRAVDRVTDVMRVDAALVRLVDGEDLVLAVQRGLSEQFVAELARIRIVGSTSGQAVLRREPVVATDLVGREDGAHGITKEEGLVSILIVPLAVNGRVLGILGAMSRQPRHFLENEVRLLDTLAVEIGVAVENARLYEIECQRLLSLQELDRLKTDFVLTISHELRTPMAIAMASLDGLWNNWERIDDYRRRAYVSIGRQGAKRLKRLLEKLLLVSRIETSAFTLRIEPIDLRDAFDEAIASIQGPQRDQIAGDLEKIASQEGGESSRMNPLRHAQPFRQIQVDVPDPSPVVFADRIALTEVLGNLIDNALKYSAAGSLVRVGVSLVPSASGAEAGALAGGWDGRLEARLSIADEGIGIAPADMSRLFRRFERIDQTVRSSTGTGLGLYICRQLVEGMGGRVWAESAPDEGSTFTVALRATEPAHASGDESEYPKPEDYQVAVR